DVVEIIEYDFGANARHGIERVLVTTQRYDDDHDRRYPLTVTSVSATDAPASYTVTDVGNGRERVRVGDPNRTITGRHAYTIEYRLDGVVNPHAGADELYWNATGHEWSVRIDHVDIEVRNAQGAERVACFAGAS